MSHPRWHLKEHDEHVARDEYYNKRRTTRRRPVQDPETAKKATIVATSTAKIVFGEENATQFIQQAKVKRAVVPTIDLTKISQTIDADADGSTHKYRPKKVTSTAKRTGTSRLTTRAERDAFRARFKLLSEDKQKEIHHQADPGRCYEAAMQFCPGLSNNFAGFLSCVLENVHKFHDHDEHCRQDFPDYYGPCIPDMLKHCPDLDSFETIQCIVKLAKGDAQILDASGLESSGSARQLTNECLASEALEIMTHSTHSDRATVQLSDNERRMMYKYQQFWLSQQHENLSEEEKADYLGHVHLQVKEAHEDSFPASVRDVLDSDSDDEDL